MFPMSLLRRTQIPWIAAVLGVIATLIAYFVTSTTEQAGLRAEFERRSQVIASTIDLSLQRHEDTLYSLRNLFHYSGSVTREEFAGAAQDLMQRHAGIRALEWVDRVPGHRRAEVEAAVRAEGFPGFQFSSRGSPGLQRAPDRPEHFPVLYVHPYLPNKAALGFDLVSGSTWPDLQQAARENTLVATGRLPLITDGRQSDWGYIFELPVYQLPVPADPQSRWKALRGFLLGIFQLSEVIEGSLREIVPQNQGLDLLIVDQRAPIDRRFLYYRPAWPSGPVTPPTRIEIQDAAFHRAITLAVPGRVWELHFRASPDWLVRQRRYESLFVVLTGLAGTVLISIYLRSILRRTGDIEREVAVRTEELRRTQQDLEDDIQRRIAAEQALKASETRLQAILDHSPNSIFVKDLAGRYVMVNREIALQWGRSVAEFLGKDDLELFPGGTGLGFREADQRALAGNAAIKYEVTISLPGAADPITTIVQKFPLRDAGGQVYGLCGIATDITDRKQAEQEKITIERKLLAAQKLESLGVLAGGIAHDFNNILTSVLANASLARHDAGAGRPVDRSLQQIEQAARRAADLCQQMLAYAGKGKIVSDRLDLSELVGGTAALLEVTISKSTRLDLQLADGLPPVLADVTQLRQIVMNLVINAADAIGDRPGLITVTTFTREADVGLLHNALGHPDLPPGTYVGLEVTDNGSGMSPETIARIFEPFFTTKFSGRGLGLSAVLGIVQSHRGALFVESTPGQGSTFRLLLPATAGEPVSSALPFPAVAGAVVLRGTVLIVDDEEAVRRIAAIVLEMHGADSLTAASGDAALDLLRTAGEKISLVLLDMTMPGINGEETLRRMRMLNARQPVILMSGYSETEIMRRSADLGVAGFIQKPFEVETLLTKVKPFLA